MNRFASCLAALAVTVSAAAAPPPKQDSQPTFLGVIDAEGMLTPIAVYDGHDWWNRWPWGAENEEIKALRLPPSLDAIPDDWLPEGLRFPADWRVLRPSGRSVRIWALTPARRSGFEMMDTIVVRTTFPKQSDPDVEVVAVAGPGQLGRFVRVRPQDAKPILTELRTLIAELERNEVARWRAADPSFYASATLSEVATVVTSDGVRIVPAPLGSSSFGLTKAAVTVGGRTYYYLDGEKLFTMRAGDDCMMNLSTDGVVVVGRNGHVVSQRLSSSAYAEYCGDRAEWTQPMAALSVGNRILWIVKNSVEDGYDYSLFDPDTGSSVHLKGTWELRKSRMTR